MAEHLPPLPRNLPSPTPRDGKVAGISGLGCVRLFIIPHLLIGLGLIVLLVSKVCIGLFGTPAEAEVVELSTAVGSKKSRTYHVHYQFYPAGSQSIVKSEQKVSRDAYSSMSTGAHIPIRYLGLWPKQLSAYQPEGSRLPHNTIVWACFTAFWNLIAGTFVYFLYIRPRRQKRPRTPRTQ